MEASEIPNFVKVSHPCQYGISEADVNALDSQTKPVVDEVQLGSPVSDYGPGLGVDKNKEVMSIDDSGVRKRKRINPTPLVDISCVPSIAADAFRTDNVVANANATVASKSSTNVIEIVDANITTTVPTVNDDAIDSEGVVAKKVKKRIAPVLVSSTL